MEKYNYLISNLQKTGGIYQDIVLGGRLMVKGRSPVDCKERWNNIKPYLKDNSVIVEIGSAEGYFTIKIAKEFPDSLVWSFEEDKQRAELQKELLKQEGLKNVVLCNYKLWVDDLYYLSQCVEGIDTFLVLSVVHHHPPEESEIATQWISKMSPEMIVEFPMLKEKGKEYPDTTQEILQNQYSNFGKVIEKYFKQVNQIGKADLGTETRPIYLCQNDFIEREYISSWFTRKLVQERPIVNKLIYKEGKWHLKRKYKPYDATYNRPEEKWITGLLAYNVLEFNPIYPEPKTIKEQGIKAYKDLARKGEKPTEIGLRNLLITPKGIAPIDWKHNDPHFSREIFNKELKKIC